MAVRQVAIGAHTVPVVAQPVPVLCDILGVSDLSELFSGGSDPFAALRERFAERPYMDLYGLMCDFIPALGEKMALHEWGGYASEEAMHAGQRNRESARNAPTGDQILEAIEAIVMANGGERLGKLLALVQTVQAVTPANGAPVSQRI